MVDFSNINTSKEDVDLISKIAKRTVKNIYYALSDPMSIMMDLEVVHSENPLRLREMLEASDDDFFHDIRGIRFNLNKETGKLENCFLPRFSKLKTEKKSSK